MSKVADFANLWADDSNVEKAVESMTNEERLALIQGLITQIKVLALEVRKFEQIRKGPNAGIDAIRTIDELKKTRIERDQLKDALDQANAQIREISGKIKILNELLLDNDGRDLIEGLKDFISHSEKELPKEVKEVETSMAGVKEKIATIEKILGGFEKRLEESLDSARIGIESRDAMVRTALADLRKTRGQLASVMLELDKTKASDTRLQESLDATNRLLHSKTRDENAARDAARNAHSINMKAAKAINALEAEIAELKSQANDLTKKEERAKVKLAKSIRNIRRKMATAAGLGILLGGIGTVIGSGAAMKVLKNKPLERYCDSDTVSGTFIDVTNNHPIEKGELEGYSINSLIEKGADTIVDLFPGENNIDKSGLCEFNDGELPTILASHDISQSAERVIAVTKEDDIKWLYFKPDKPVSTLYRHGKYSLADTSTSPGEEVVLLVDGVPVIREVVKSQYGVNIGFLHAVNWMSSRWAETLGVSHTEVTKTPEFTEMHSITVTGEYWRDKRKDVIDEMWERNPDKIAADKKRLRKLVMGGIGTVCSLITVAMIMGLRSTKKRRREFEEEELNG